MGATMQGKRLVALAAAKRHMVVMSSEGDIYTWGHRVVTPRRVQLAGGGLCCCHGLCLQLVTPSRGAMLCVVPLKYAVIMR